jgi:hypothetical protein
MATAPVVGSHCVWLTRRNGCPVDHVGIVARFQNLSANSSSAGRDPIDARLPFPSRVATDHCPRLAAFIRALSVSGSVTMASIVRVWLVDMGASVA